MVVKKSKTLFASFLLLFAAGCQSPFLVFPGKEIKGEIATTESFAFAKAYSLLMLETRPHDPYSVYLRVTVIDGQLYIDAAPSRRWHEYIHEDNHVRIQLGGKIYSAKAVVVKDKVVEDKSLKSRFMAGRTIYRIVPS